MKLNWKGRLLFTFIIGLIILFFVQNPIGTSILNRLNIGDSGPMPTELHPTVRDRSNQLIQQAAAKGIVMVITDDFRSAEDQDRLYEQGRTVAGNIVTNARGGESFHNFGLAIDFAIKTPSTDIIWDMQYDGNQNGIADWNEVVEMAKALGFEWGGDWSQFKDYPHLQMNFGLTLADLQNGKRPADISLTADTD
ncbi:peptidoglycan L-alanyl-D-glutamate endopeptidase CwlK [Neobacillus niacini]|uniref:M15 family metallopeptidase n=1 Tax=Neobacillus driksii TaxID=3035913 RepID=UPI00277FBAD9|nr:M15 family metallopeptidase [Neobacillus niacini]MDQ0973840.1 peptidoglycan L-alanyl-D-glutamate endopeptidase CwlK [Neobacillus niacini]